MRKQDENTSYNRRMEGSEIKILSDMRTVVEETKMEGILEMWE